jgi:hypothetical protein
LRDRESCGYLFHIIEMETLSEDVIWGVVEGNGVTFAAGTCDAAGKGQEVRHSVEVAADVLRRKATAGVQDQERGMPGHHGLVSHGIVAEAGQGVKPAYGRRVVPNREDTVLRVGVEALQPNVDRHSQEFKQVIDFGAAVEDTARGDAEAPGAAGFE